MTPHVAIVGAGPAGLMAAEVISAKGIAATIYDRMPAPGRKLLMAGRGGLNLTHSEPLETFIARYGSAADRLRPAIEAFPPAALVSWAEGLGQPTFVGSSGRIFPKSLKASPLLRAWLARLAAQGVKLELRHDWRGWDGQGRLLFQRPDREEISVDAPATILALGGASWPKLGATGAWSDILRARGAAVTPFQPANMGVNVPWSDNFRARFSGTPLKGIAMSFDGESVRGEAMITDYGLEGGAVYQLSSRLRDAISNHSNATISIDLRPDFSPSQLANKLEQPRAAQSLSNYLRRTLSLTPASINLLREAHGSQLATDATALSRQIKSAPITLTGTQSLDRAISTAGGISLDAIDETFMLRQLPGVYAIGEMLDWEAPTGGYLLQASFSTAVAAANAMLNRTRLPPTGQSR